ncbi:hypothetical protein EMIHUDRAFT_252033 [Emiliania huxleyi CCMP1516]|uniref:IBB domain-containing protein n=2 Tax=Emiliania huxleyi TaxID=2903 RepID=A0A0D3KPA2_EMIH1|nr:hypothetical protein EMIHUDRAFT_252033 [Emiliania huxleyi CCMP1516]EOD37587.1 hypothetical protein EMIHUDRAFT_252033 [Emiliania huxleyi CCMP1516]|eukprot:XP_005790016.1 hypothetical protein EMIHUDRAFT_252033 [Emiliania huxleyi CCMP1516]
MRASLPSSPSRRGRSRGLDADDARSRRNENKIELRKAKKDETLAKRRFAQPADAAAEEPTDPAAAAADAVANACCRRRLHSKTAGKAVTQRGGGLSAARTVAFARGEASIAARCMRHASRQRVRELLA